MLTFAVAAVPVVLVLIWRTGWDAGKKYGQATNLLTIRGARQALLIDNEALEMIPTLKLDLRSEGWDERNLFAEDRSVYARPGQYDYLWRSTVA